MLARSRLAALAAVFFPLLLTATAVPDSVFYHQAAAVAGWGLWLFLGADRERDRRAGTPALACGVAALLWLALHVVKSIVQVGNGHATAALMLAAGMVLWSSSSRHSEADVAPMAFSWWLVGVGSALVALVQFVAPSLADSWLIAATGTPGRAVGNMRQPNHLATALLCALVMTAWLWQANRLPAGVGAASMVAMVLGVALSASRTGGLSLAVLVAWAAVDRTLPRPARWILAATPVLYLVCWYGAAQFAALHNGHFYAIDRFRTDGDISSSRFAIWRNAVALIGSSPWLGVGWGNFNFAWTFTAFPDRPTAFFDHTHNALLQLAVEIGVPATGVLLALLGGALWSVRAAWQADADVEGNQPARATLVMLVVIGLHSMLEYPLWYAYFLLPAAWALGVVIGAARARPLAVLSGRCSRIAVASAGFAMLFGAVFAAWDHRRVEVIFAPPHGAAPLERRIAEGQRSTLFGHHADYAAVTSAPDQSLEIFRRPLHQLIDTRLLIAYIEALHAAGRQSEALYAAQRLREFRRADAQGFFDTCNGAAPPFQCRRDPVSLIWRDLEP